MPSPEDNKLTGTFTKYPEVLEFFKQEAATEGFSTSYLVVRACVEYYRRRKDEAALFTQTQSLAEKREVPVYETPNQAQTAAERASKIRELHGPEKS